jgi:hypothetical protein
LATWLINIDSVSPQAGRHTRTLRYDLDHFKIASITMPKKVSAKTPAAKKPTKNVAAEEVLSTQTDSVVNQIAPTQSEPDTDTQAATRWIGDGWTAQVMKNEDDDGWAVAMTLDGKSEPTLIGPWTMGRDKKNPKPLDANAFATLVKTANEIIRRHEHQAHAALNKSTKVATDDGRVTVSLQIIADEDNPYAMLRAHDSAGALLSEAQVQAQFKFNHDIASSWVQSGFAKPKRMDD